MYVHYWLLEITQANHPISIKHAFASGNFSNLKMIYAIISAFNVLDQAQNWSKPRKKLVYSSGR